MDTGVRGDVDTEVIGGLNLLLGVGGTVRGVHHPSVYPVERQWLPWRGVDSPW